MKRRIDMSKEDKTRALESALAQIEKQYGKGSVMKLGDTASHMNIETIPTGSISLDIALGLGGIPKGRIVEVYGPESSGKTTVALHMVAEVQKRGGIAGFIDAEHASPPRRSPRAATPDKLPLIGPHVSHKRLYLATGHEGLGITTSLATARLLVDQIMGRQAAIRIEPYLPSRVTSEPIHA
jgi:RecA/RadA recombinase